MSALDAKVPPPLVALIIGTGMWLASRAFGPTSVSFPVHLGLAAVLFLLGLGISVAGVREIRRAKTTINPTKPETASALVSTGIYRYTRNPMYLGMATWLLAWAAWLAAPVGLLGVPLFMLYMNRFQIMPEERALTSLFGGEFAAFKERVRRWL